MGRRPARTACALIWAVSLLLPVAPEAVRGDFQSSTISIGSSPSTILDRGPFGVSRNPLYLGLIALDVALALLWPSLWALAFVPAGVVALWWGAILPEERYLSGKFGAEYDMYRTHVRRWL